MILTKLSANTFIKKSRIINKEQKQKKEIELSKYLDRKLRKKYKNKSGEWLRDRRPKELKYLHVAKACGFSYKEVRTRFDWLVKNGIIEKFHAWNQNGTRRNYYRFLDW